MFPLQRFENTCVALRVPIFFALARADNDSAGGAFERAEECSLILPFVRADRNIPDRGVGVDSEMLQKLEVLCCGRAPR